MKQQTPALILANTNSRNPMVMYHLKIKGLMDITVNESLLSPPNTFLVNLPIFKVKGRYNEDFTGHFGYEYLYLQRVWAAAGCTRTLLSNTDIFEVIGFGTSNLNRDWACNPVLVLQKLGADCKTAPSILRFAWEQIDFIA